MTKLIFLYKNKKQKNIQLNFSFIFKWFQKEILFLMEIFNSIILIIKFCIIFFYFTDIYFILFAKKKFFFLRPKQVCFRYCKNPSSHLQSPVWQVLLATFNEHCSLMRQSCPRRFAVIKKTKFFLYK